MIDEPLVSEPAHAIGPDATRSTRTAPSTGPLVSVILNNYNYERYLATAVRSALAQRWGNLEVIVVDDGSTDGSLASIADIDDPRLVVIEQRNGGQAAAMNTGFAASSGELVLFLDADDVLYPGAVPTLVGLLEPGVAKLQFRLDVVDGEGEPLGRIEPPATQVLPSGDLRDRILTRGRYVTPVTSGNAFARTALEQILPIPTEPFRLCADGYLVYSAAFEGDVVSVDRSLGAYRVHGANLWTGRQASAGKLESTVRHDEDKYRAIRAAAERHGLVAGDLARADHWHLRVELALTREPGEHARPWRRRLPLALRAIRLTVTDPMVVPRSRLKLSAWAAIVAVGPAGVAGKAIADLFGTRLPGAKT